MQQLQRINSCPVIYTAMFLTVAFGSLNSLSHGQASPNEVQPVRPVTVETSPAEEKIFAALEEPTQMEFIGTSLADVTLSISKRHQIPIVLDTRELDGVGIGSDTPVTLSIKKIPLRSALKLLLKELELTWVVRDEVLLITTEEEAEFHLVTHVYEVPDLMRSPLDGELDAERLIELITSTVSPYSWDEVGGSGSMNHFQGRLVISQMQETHREIQTMLTQLRTIDHALQAQPKQAFAHRWNLSPEQQSEAVKRIHAALHTKVPQFQFQETALHDVVFFLQKQTGIPILLDSRELNAVGVGTDTPITVHLSNISLRSALKLMLKELELTFVVRHHVLMITTREEAESKLLSAAYVVRDLVDISQGSSTDANSLIQLITTTIAPQSWDEVGGPGNIQYFELTDTLVLSQTEEVLAQIDMLLAKLRKARGPWSAEGWKKRREEYWRTPRFYSYLMKQQHGELFMEPRLALSLIEKELSEETRQRANLRHTKDTVTMLLTPLEHAKVARAIRRMHLPMYEEGFGMGRMNLYRRSIGGGSDGGQSQGGFF